MLATKHLSTLILFIMLTACSGNSNNASTTYEITALLTCNEAEPQANENQKTIYCEQPENGMTADMVSPYISALTTCGVSWQAMQDRRLNEYVFSDVISNHFKNDVSSEPILTPVIPLRIFDLPVKSFRSGFGMLPGFVVTFDSDFETIKSTLASTGINFEICNYQSCEIKLTESETLILRDAVFGCAYPFQQ